MGKQKEFPVYCFRSREGWLLGFGSTARVFLSMLARTTPQWITSAVPRSFCFPNPAQHQGSTLIYCTLSALQTQLSIGDHFCLTRFHHLCKPELSTRSSRHSILRSPVLPERPLSPLLPAVLPSCRTQLKTDERRRLALCTDTGECWFSSFIVCTLSQITGSWSFWVSAHLCNINAWSQRWTAGLKLKLTFVAFQTSF